MVDFLKSEEAAALEKVSSLAKLEGLSLWVVGGVVRDSLLGSPNRLADIDLVVEGDAGAFSQKVAAEFNAKNMIYADFLTAKVLGIPAIGALDLASTRKEQYAAPGALPDVVIGTLNEDSQRRDFSINALYVELYDFISTSNQDLRTKVSDDVGGLPDLDSKIVRILHTKSFIDDPTRLFRALRYKIRIEGQLEPDTQALFDSSLSSDCLKTISAQRILNEIMSACEEKNWKSVVKEFSHVGLISSAGLIEKERIDYFEMVMSQHCEVQRAEDRFELVIAALYFLSALDIREERFRHYGFGKKFFKRMQTLTKDISSIDNEIKKALRIGFAAAGLELEG